MDEILDLAKIDIKVRSQMCQDLFKRLATLLEVHCTGYLLILSEDIDKVYIKLRHSVENIIGSEGFESLLEVYSASSIPDSLHSLGADADIDWEHGIKQSINNLMGNILELCVSVEADYNDCEDVFKKKLLEPYDRCIESFKNEKKKSEKIYFDRVEVRLACENKENPGTDKTLVEYVDLERIKELKEIKSNKFDLSKLIQLCEELNKCYSSGCYLAVAMLLRAMIDHIPPILGCTKFTEISNNYSAGGKSFKDSMINLGNSSRKIADAHLHTQIRSKESLPNKMQVNFSSDLDVLLAELVRVLK
jgi:hypothetical protein